MHERRLFLGIALLLLGGGAARAAPPRTLRLVAADSLACPTVAEVREALARRVAARLVARGGDLTLTLAAPAAGRLRIRLDAAGAPPLERQLAAASGECGSLAQTVALVVDGWLAELPWRGAAPAPRRRRPPIAAAPRPVTAPEPPPPLPPPPPVAAPEPPPVVVATPEPPPPPVPVPVPAPVPVPVPVPAPVPDKPAAPAVAIRETPAPTVEKPAPRARRTALHLAVRLDGGGTLGAGAGVPVTGAGTAAIELGLGERWDVGVRVAATGPVDARRDPGTVTVERVPIGVYARVGLHRRGASGPSLLAGLDLEVLAASASGFSSNGALTVVEPGLLLGAAWDLRLHDRVALFAEAAATVLPFNHSFDVGNLGPVVETPRVWLSLAAGLAIRFF